MRRKSKMRDALKLLTNALTHMPDGPERRAALEVERFWRRPAAPGNGRVALWLSGDALPAEAEWIWRLRKGDIAAPGALAAIEDAISQTRADAILLDDVVLRGGRALLRAKPSFDPILLLSTDYIGGGAVFRRSALTDGELSRLSDGGAAGEVLAGWDEARIARLPCPALISEDAPVDAPNFAAKPSPVGVVIPNRNSPALIRRALAGVLDATDHPEISVTVIDNGSDDPATLAIYEERRADPRFQVEIRPAPFNFSAMVNRGVSLSTSERILLLNNDIEVFFPNWLQQMEAVMALPDVGVVGAKLLFPDRTIQHAGVILGHGGVAGHDWKGAPGDAEDALGRLRLPHCRTAVTAAAMLTTRALWNELGGFDERAFPVAFNDVDFCIRAWAAGRRVAMAPGAVLIHHEGKSRKKGVSLRRWAGHQRERAALRRRHGTKGMIDRFENPWRDHEALIPEYRAPDGPPRPI